MALPQNRVPGPRTQQVRQSSPWEVTVAGQQGKQEVFDVLLCKLSPVQVLQCWRLTPCQTPSCSCLRTGHGVFIGHPPSPRVPATFLLTLVFPFVMGLFTGRAKTRERERKGLRLLTGAISLHPGKSNPSLLDSRNSLTKCFPSNRSLPKTQINQQQHRFCYRPPPPAPRRTLRDCTEEPQPFPTGGGCVQS